MRANQPDLPVILLTAWTHLESAVQLVKAGAADYIGKPWDNDKLLASVENLLELAEATRERQRLQDEQRRRRERLAEQYDLCGVVFASDAMERVVELACRVARADVRVLITGPNGAGKERIAQIVHANSAIRSGPFVAINCGAIPSELIEAELFGAEAGAYTGATRARTGRFEMADGGTLFLDEIGDLPLAGQVKLLRVLETGPIRDVGFEPHPQHPRAHLERHQCRSCRADSRRPLSRRSVLPAQCHRDRGAVAGGAARRYLAAGPAFSRRGTAAERRRGCGAAGARLARKRARAAQFNRTRQASGARKVVTAADLNLPAPQRAAAEGDANRRGGDALISRGGEALPGRGDRDAEQPSRELIEACLREAGGNISRAAQSLGLSRQALYRRMERFNLRPSG